MYDGKLLTLLNQFSKYRVRNCYFFKKYYIIPFLHIKIKVYSLSQKNYCKNTNCVIGWMNVLNIK